MGFGKFKNEKQAELLHKIELYDLDTGEPAFVDGIRQYVIVKGEKSRAYQNSVEQQAAQDKRKGKGADTFSYEQGAKTLARRITGVIVSALIDAGEDEPDIIQFDDISALSEKERNIEKGRLYDLLVTVTDLTVLINDEVVKSLNFLPGRGQSLSSLLSNVSGTTPHQMDETDPV